MSARPNAALTPLLAAWLILITLTLLSVWLGEHFHGFAWLQLLVAAIIWIKGALVARYFIESEIAHPFIRNVVRAFVAITPIALALTAFYGAQFARWATL